MIIHIPQIITNQFMCNYIIFAYLSNVWHYSLQSSLGLPMNHTADPERYLLHRNEHSQTMQDLSFSQHHCLGHNSPENLQCDNR